MAFNRQAKRVVIVATVVSVSLLVAGIAFVSYFMHAVYETEPAVINGEISPTITEAFHRQFQGATDVVWSFEDDLFEAEFRWRGQGDCEAHYKPDGTWVKTVVPISFDALPGPAQQWLRAQSGYRAMEAERIETAGAPLKFEAKLANALLEWDCEFDAAGNLITKTRDGPVLE